MGDKSIRMSDGIFYSQTCPGKWTPVGTYDRIREEYEYCRERLIEDAHYDMLKLAAPLIDYTEFWKIKTVPREYRIDKVIFNGPATIVFWQDGTKTVVKCGPNDVFDKEKGIAMCFVKKIYQNKGKYNNVFKPWIEEEK